MSLSCWTWSSSSRPTATWMTGLTPQPPLPLPPPSQSPLHPRVPFLTEGSAACALGLATGLALLLFHNTLSWGVVQQLLEFNAAGFFT